jgi:hypothetical protein
MWKKVNLADPQNLAAVASQGCQILAEKLKKGKKNSIQQSGVTKSGLCEEKKMLKMVKKGKKLITAVTHYVICVCDTNFQSQN